MKRKFSIFLNIVLFVVCVGSLAYGVFSAQRATLSVTGNLGFTAHNCLVTVSGYMYGHTTGSSTNEPVSEENKVYLKKPNNTDATPEKPLAVKLETGSLSFGTDPIYFSMPDSEAVANDITIVLTIKNTDSSAVLVEDTTTDRTYTNYTITCDNQLQVLYTDTEPEKVTTVTYTISPKKDSNGTYTSITNTVSISIKMNFSQVDTTTPGSTSYWTVDASGNLKSVPTKAQNNNSDMLIIPASVTDGTTTTAITAINAGTSAQTNLSYYKKVVVLKGVTSLYNNAFNNCSSLTSVTLPSSVTNILGSAFMDCSSLRSITIPSSVTSIGGSAFFGCRSLTSITIPSSVTSIGGNAFQNCSSLTSITIPSGVTSIGSSAFSGCWSLTSITIPSSVTNIGGNSFAECSSLASIKVDSGNTKYDSRNNCNAIIEKPSNTLILGCKNTVIPSSVTSIGSSAFFDCSGLTSITIPSSVTSIGSSAFSGCSGLTSITIPSSVTNIDGNSFAECSSLASIKVDSGNTKYDSRNNCNAIIEKPSNTLILGCKNTVIPSSVTSIGSSAFFGCSGLTSITIPSGVTGIGSNAFSGCSGLTNITIPSSITSIGGYAFRDCSSLTSITIPSRVTSIGEWTFKDCSSLTSITIPSGVTDIGVRAFSGCSSLTSITIPSGVTNIGNYVFQNCSSLTSITIPSGVTYIGQNAFQDCSSLTSITIPSSVTDIGRYAFRNCTSLTSATFKTTTGWYVGKSAGKKTTPLSSTDLANTSKAATYLKKDYSSKYWTKE